MPTQQRLVEMQDDLAYKEQQMKNAENTHERLGQARCMRIGPNGTLFAHSDTLWYHRQELELRNMELEKINTLDTKINVRSLISEASQRSPPLAACDARESTHRSRVHHAVPTGASHAQMRASAVPTVAQCRAHSGPVPCAPVPRMHHRRARHGWHRSTRRRVGVCL